MNLKSNFHANSMNPWKFFISILFNQIREDRVSRTSYRIQYFEFIQIFERFSYLSDVSGSD
jgi:hypothetical protein